MKMVFSSDTFEYENLVVVSSCWSQASIWSKNWDISKR